MSSKCSKLARLQPHNLLRLGKLGRELFTALPNQLVPDPINEAHEVHVLKLRASRDLSAQGIGKKAQEEGLHGGRAHFLAVLIQEVKPLINLVVEVAHGRTLWKIKKTGTPCHLHQLIRALILGEQLSPQF